MVWVGVGYTVGYDSGGALRDRFASYRAGEVDGEEDEEPRGRAGDVVAVGGFEKHWGWVLGLAGLNGAGGGRSLRPVLSHSFMARASG